jgi:hypothetical protein
MKALLSFTVLLLSAVIAPAALLAQSPAPPPVPPPHRARVSAGQLLEGQSATASFDALHAILDTGYEVVVRDAAGRKTRGRVSSISDDRIVIFREGTTPLLRLTKPAVEHRFSADSVTRIDIVDSTWNGTLIGAAVGVGLAFGIHQWEESAVADSNDLKGLWTLALGGISIAVSSGVGSLIDLSMNAPIYKRPSQTPRVSLVPLLGRERIGLMARVHF